MTSEDLAAVRASIMVHEGFSPRAVPDTKGQVIGYGHNTLVRSITQARALTILDDDLAETEEQLVRAWPPFDDCDGPRQRAVLELAYQTGVAGFLRFTDLLAALVAKDYAGAVRALQNSALEHQTPTRVAFYITLLRS